MGPRLLFTVAQVVLFRRMCGPPGSRWASDLLAVGREQADRISCLLPSPDSASPCVPVLLSGYRRRTASEEGVSWAKRRPAHSIVATSPEGCDLHAPERGSAVSARQGSN